MINVIANKNCCGCNACEQVCPKHCIDYFIDSEGFKYPVVDGSRCIDCSLCEKVCPMLNKFEKVKPLSVEAMRFLNEQKRLESSSGGVFTAIAEEIIRREGVVFGASYSGDWHVVHTYSETIEGIKPFRGSKYVQSDTKNAYSQVKEFLKSDRWVLFSGTPCQVRGLLLFLRKPYEKLLTADFICHGVPSHDVLKAYVNNEIRNKYKGKHVHIKDIRFRDKINGWKRFCFALSIESNGRVEEFHCLKSAYMKGFGANLFLRPSCYNCPTKNFTSGADITLADYWRIETQHPDMDDDKGTSLIAIHTDKGKTIFEDISNLETRVVEFDEAYRIQTALFHSMPMPQTREEFWSSDWKEDFINVVNKIADRKTFNQRSMEVVKFVLRSLGVKKILGKFSKRYI